MSMTRILMPMNIGKKVKFILVSPPGNIRNATNEDEIMPITGPDISMRNNMLLEVKPSDMNHDGDVKLQPEISNTGYSYFREEGTFQNSPSTDVDRQFQIMGYGLWSGNPIAFNNADDEDWDESYLPFGGVLFLEAGIHSDICPEGPLKYLYIRPVMLKGSDPTSYYRIGWNETAGQPYEFGHKKHGISYNQNTALCEEGRQKMERKMRGEIDLADEHGLYTHSAFVLPFIDDAKIGGKAHNQSPYSTNKLKVNNQEDSYFEYIIYVGV